MSRSVALPPVSALRHGRVEVPEGLVEAVVMPKALNDPPKESFPLDCSEHIQVIEIQREKNISQQHCRRPVRHISNLMFLLRNIPENSKPKFQCLSMTNRFQAEEISSAPAEIERRLRR